MSHNPCGDITGPLEPLVNRSEACTAVSGDAVSCYGVTWVTKNISAINDGVDWTVIERPGVPI